MRKEKWHGLLLKIEANKMCFALFASPNPRRGLWGFSCYCLYVCVCVCVCVCMCVCVCERMAGVIDTVKECGCCCNHSRDFTGRICWPPLYIELT